MAVQSVWAVLFALLAAASNATATVLQRKAARTVPLTAGLRLRLITELLHRPVWLAGFGAVALAACFQALALSQGALALVQPLFVLELPLAMLLAGFVLGRRLTRGSWLAVLAVVAGLGVALVAAHPQGGTTDPSGARWAVAAGSCVVAVALLVAVAAGRPPGRLRAGALAAGSAIGNALTAALMKSATRAWQSDGVTGFLLAWQTYGFALAGVGAVFLLQNAMQSGPLVASQPALTLTDALVSLALGVALFEETVRTGWWLVPELLGAVAIAAGAVTLARTPLARLLAATDGEAPPGGRKRAGDGRDRAGGEGRG